MELGGSERPVVWMSGFAVFGEVPGTQLVDCPLNIAYCNGGDWQLRRVLACSAKGFCERCVCDMPEGFNIG